jgi:hypothetical protein
MFYSAFPARRWQKGTMPGGFLDFLPSETYAIGQGSQHSAKGNWKGNNQLQAAGGVLGGSSGKLTQHLRISSLIG